ncbi:FAD-dependent monooxygenase [Streptomyces sp. NBC_00445]|uniref:FAD-dependent oxidoreductase n=1 Tax=Streptomyces sp. NBC_00445 TaxID=2975745 RepID=UPI002E1C7B2E
MSAAEAEGEVTLRKAVVIGGSVAGLLTGQVLSAEFDEVVVIDRDNLDATNSVRRGVPQGRHPHTLLRRGEQILNTLFPGITDDLIRHGAVVMPMDRVWWWQHRGYRAAVPDAAPIISCSRPLLECLVRERVRGNGAVEFRSGETVDLISRGGAVTGVLVRGPSGTSTAIGADLVVDCSGRRSRASHWLTELGYPSPEVQLVESDVRYTTRIFQRSTSVRTDGAAGYFVISDPKARKRFGTAMPVEGDRWIITLAGLHGEGAPADLAGYLSWAQTLPTAKIASIIEDERPVGAAVRYRLPGSEWRLFHRLAAHPRGFVCVGDSVCSLNALYGQGMTSAAVQVVALQQALARSPVTHPEFARTFYRLSARAVSPAWTTATGADFVYPETRGHRPWPTNIINRYVTKCVVAGQHDSTMATSLWDVANMVKPPASLLSPPALVKTMRYSRRGPLRSCKPITPR